MCFEGPDTGGMEAAMQEQADAQMKALKLQEDAIAQAKAAAIPAEDSESARRAGEERMRDLLEGAGPGGLNLTGAAPLGYRALMGA